MTTASNAPDESVDHDERFEVLLPIGDDTPTTHVACLRGDEVAFLSVLGDFVATGSAASLPLTTPIDVDAVRDALAGLGHAEVESIEPVAR
ncbi:MAG: hypothetical protein ABW122_15120 [Ilumatobacteraceae bacterium]